MTKSLRTMMVTPTSKIRELVKLLERLSKQEQHFSKEKIIEMKKQLRVVKKELAELESKVSKGFGK